MLTKKISLISDLFLEIKTIIFILILGSSCLFGSLLCVIKSAGDNYKMNVPETFLFNKLFWHCLSLKVRFQTSVRHIFQLAVPSHLFNLCYRKVNLIYKEMRIQLISGQRGTIKETFCTLASYATWRLSSAKFPVLDG